jgi:muconolactone delta-isomerase
MQFIVFGKLSEEYDGEPIEGLQEVLKGEWAKSREWYAKGLLRQSWLFENNEGSIGIFEVESREKMDEMIAEYPGIEEGFVTADVHVIEPYPGFYPDMVE